MKQKIYSHAIRALVLPLLLLAGCGPTLAPKLPHISYETVSHPVLYSGKNIHTSRMELSSLSDFVATVPLSAASHIAIATHDMAPLAIKRARGIRNYLVKRGADRNLVRLVPNADIDTEVIVLTVQYAQGVPPAPCPDWSKNSIIDYQSQGSSNFGCAYQNDFILQLANPADYDGGHGTPVSESPRDSMVLQRYMLDTPQPAASAGAGTSSSSSPGGGTTSTSTSTP